MDGQRCTMVERSDELPEELAFRESRLRRIRRPWQRWRPRPGRRPRRLKSEGRKQPGAPDDKAKRYFTDLESRTMPGPGGRGFQQAYNCQAVVDDAHQVVVAAEATNQASDQQRAVSMIEQAIANTGVVPREVSADAGYYSARAAEGLIALGVDPFIAPDKTRHGQAIPAASRGRIPVNLSARDRMRRKLRTKRGRWCDAIRMETVEPVLGQIKQGRGFRQFLLRGLKKVNREWSLICPGHSLLKLFRFGSASAAPGRSRPLGRNPLLPATWPMLRQWRCHRPKRTKPVIAIWFSVHLNQPAFPRTGC